LLFEFPSFLQEKLEVSKEIQTMLNILNEKPNNLLLKEAVNQVKGDGI